MKKMLILAMTMAMVLLAAAGVCETLRVGMECNYAPYNWTQSDASENAVAIAAGGYADGYDVRIAKIIAEYSVLKPPTSSRASATPMAGFTSAPTGRRWERHSPWARWGRSIGYGTGQQVALRSLMPRLKKSGALFPTVRRLKFDLN